MESRIEIALKECLPDQEGLRLSNILQKQFGILATCRYLDVYNFEEHLTETELETLARDVFTDPISQKFSVSKPLFPDFWRLEIGMRPVVTDNIGKTATAAVRDKLGRNLLIYHSRIYAFSFKGIVSGSGASGGSTNSAVGVHGFGTGFTSPDFYTFEKIASLLHNSLVEQHKLYEPNEEPKPHLPTVHISNEPTVERFSLALPKTQLVNFARGRLLALNEEELEAIKRHFKGVRFLRDRKSVGLDERITDVELEVIAQTWSEHCKHKIFNALISYDEDGEIHAINSLFATFIKGATGQVKKPYIVSVFKDNGGIIKFDPDHDLVVKVETHNAPSALDPYGGALTGILGVQRNILGTGLGAMPIANMYVLCFGPQNLPAKDVPKGILHPSVVSEGVIKGIEHGGNKMGIPTVNGSIFYDSGFTARPLVYCGTLGLMPS